MTMTFKSLCAGIALCGASAVAFAASNPLSVHVLNLQDGLPSPGVKVLLEKQDGTAWTQLSSGTTNEQGRIPALYPEGKALEKATTASPSKPASGLPSTKPHPSSLKYPSFLPWMAPCRTTTSRCCSAHSVSRPTVVTDPSIGIGIINGRRSRCICMAERAGG